MRSSGGQVVVVLMLLQASALSGLRPMPPPETTCTTEETTTVTPPPTITTTAIPTTTECPIADCFLIDCRTVTGTDGCLTCDCSPYNCDNVTCDPGQECVMQDVECNYPSCPPEPSCVVQTSETTTETTTEITTTEITTTDPLCRQTPPFPHIPGCGVFVGQDGCYRYECHTCDEISCAYGTTCELQTCWSFPCPPPVICVSTTGTTTEATTETPTPSCPPPPPFPHYPGCGAYEGPDGCIRIECYTCDNLPWDPTDPMRPNIQTEVITCPEGTTCELQICWSYPCPPPYICASSTTATITCPPIPQFSNFDAGCGRFLDSDGCYRYRCYTCDDIQCGEDGTCELQTCYDFPCTHPWLCISATGRTTETTTETTTSSCPPIPPYARLPGCGAYEDPDGCMRVHCYTCDDIPCGEGTTCELQTCYDDPCPPPVICVSTTTAVPPTPTPPPTRTPTPSCPPPPPIPHYPGCGVYEGPDGCIRFECHTCDEISCSEGTTCELQTCYTYPCPPPIICVSTTGRTTETTTERTHFSCPPIRPFAGIPGCSAFIDSRGCMIVPCYTCDDIPCDEGTTCELQTCYDLPCPPPVICVAATTGTTTEMTTPVCEDMSWCTCYLDFSSGECPQCYCVDPVCGFLVRCGPDEDCLPSPDSEYGYACFSIYGTTTPLCEDLSWCTGSCGLDYSSGGCPTCLCGDPICGWLIICGPDEDCLPSPDSEYGFACFSIYGTTTETTPGTTSTDCPIVTCGPNCARSDTPGPDGCSTCECYPNCWDTPCDPGQECVFQFQCPPCFPLATCVSINDTTSVTPTPTPTPTDSTLITPTKHICPMPLCLRECPPVEGPDGCLKCVCSDFNCQNLTCDPGEECVMQEVDCPSDHPPCPPQPICVQATTTPCPQIKCARGCVSETGSDGCSFCTCPPSCNDLTCRPGEECVMQVVACSPGPRPCFAQPTCIPSQETTTSCPMYKCAPDCVPDTGSDGCPICACPPTCETVRCSDGHECQLVNVSCFRYPCFPQPQCVPVEDPCTGTPNPGRCGRGSKTRWTYNSLTDTCKSFRYYGCTPSPNTFRSRKECRNKCSGNSQIICPTFVCEDNCYTLESVANASVPTRARDSDAVRVTSARCAKQSATKNQNHSALKLQIPVPLRIRVANGACTV